MEPPLVASAGRSQATWIECKHCPSSARRPPVVSLEEASRVEFREPPAGRLLHVSAERMAPPGQDRPSARQSGRQVVVSRPLSSDRSPILISNFFNFGQQYGAGAERRDLPAGPCCHAARPRRGGSESRVVSGCRLSNRSPPSSNRSSTACCRVLLWPAGRLAGWLAGWLWLWLDGRRTKARNRWSRIG